MVSTFLIYTVLMSLMLLTGKGVLKVSHSYIGYPILYPVINKFIPCILFAFVIGCRYYVGVDYESYYLDYISGGTTRDIELGFRFLQDFMSGHELHFSYFFGILAFLQITLFLSSFNDPNLYPYLVFALFITYGFGGWMNGIRQGIANCAFAYSLQFINRKQIIPFLFCIAFGFLFHKSIIIVIPLYFLLQIQWRKNPYAQWILVAFSLFIHATNLAQNLLEPIYDPMSRFLGYSSTYSLDQALEKLASAEAGLGFVCLLLITFIIIIHSTKMRMYYNSPFVDKVYFLFLIYVMGWLMFHGQVVLSRPFGYFVLFRVATVAYTIRYLYLTRKKSTFNMLSLVALVILLFAVFIATILNEPFQFFWQIT